MSGERVLSTGQAAKRLGISSPHDLPPGGCRAPDAGRSFAQWAAPVLVSIKGERSNAGLWRYSAGLDAAVAWQVAAAIVAWAVASGLQVLVFEHPRPYRPERGLSWSRRTNRKRSYAEKRAIETSRRRKAGVAASREGSPKAVGANVRRATDAPAA